MGKAHCFHISFLFNRLPSSICFPSESLMRKLFSSPGRTGEYFLALRYQINIPRQSRRHFLCGRSPMLPATPHAALVRLAICIGPPTHTGISPSPFPSHVAAILNILHFFLLPNYTSTAIFTSISQLAKLFVSLHF